MSSLLSGSRKFKDKTLQDFKKSLKDSKFDEPVTMFVFRPVAFIFVKLIYKTRISPNHVSLFGILLGITSSLFLSTGSTRNIIIAGIIYFFAIVADNADGMLARLTKKTSPLGRIIDGFSDYIVGIAMYLGMLSAINKGALSLRPFPYDPLWIVVAGAVSYIIHVVAVDYYRVEFTAYGLGKSSSAEEEKLKYINELKKIRKQKGHFLTKILIAIFLGYSSIQSGSKVRKFTYDRKEYFEANKKLIMLWFWIGPAAHALFLFLALIFLKLPIYFFYTIIIGNIFMAVMLIIQIRVNSRLKQKLTGTES